MLHKPHFKEIRESQLPLVELLINLGYTYLSREEVMRERDENTRNLFLSGIAARQLMAINDYEVEGKSFKFSEKDVQEALDDLQNLEARKLSDMAQEVFNMVMPSAGGKTIVVQHEGKRVSKNFRYINFEHPQENSFHVAVGVEVQGKERIYPNIICYVNGIPFVVIETGQLGSDITEVLDLQVRNQGNEYCPRLYAYTQLLLGANGEEVRYGTTGTPNKFYVIWKEEGIEAEVRDLVAQPIDSAIYKALCGDLGGGESGHQQEMGREVTGQDEGVVSLLRPERLLDLTKNYTVFDGGKKKVARYQQYFAIEKILEKVRPLREVREGVWQREGGLVWHTQGSGKSLTMVMFVKALIEDPQIINPRVIVVTDRKDLDAQIRDTFKQCQLKKGVIQATSGEDLLGLIREKKLDVVTTLVHKFESAGRKRVGFVDEDPNIFVLIDEAHRSQGGMANLEMNRIIPQACYLAFTGTPLMIKERESWKKFGGYIDTYTIDDALEDGVTLPLIYQGRYTPLTQEAEIINERVDDLVQDLDEEGKREVQKLIKTQIIKDNPGRIAAIALDVESHFVEHFHGSGLKAQVVAPSKFSAVLFQRAFETSGQVKTAVVISDEQEDGEGDSHRQGVVAYLDELRTKHASLKAYETEVITSFKHDEEGIEIIIVVDKLLTGFDAPRNTVLYLAKDLRDHNLLQAIARVNRLYENETLPKTAGYIIDYSENARNIQTAMKLFGNYDTEDVGQALTDVREKVEALEVTYHELHEIFKTVKDKGDVGAHLDHLDDEQKRDEFYFTLTTFIRQFKECLVLQDFAREFKHLDRYKKELARFVELRKAATVRYAKELNLKAYKQSLIKILDEHLDAQEVEMLTRPVNITDKNAFAEAIEALESDRSKAEAIAAQTQKTIRENLDSDPEFYDRFSSKISEILDKMSQRKLEDVEALGELERLKEQVVNKEDNELPQEIAGHLGADVLYRNLQEFISSEDDHYATIVLNILQIINRESIVDWYKNRDVKRRMMNALDDYLYDTVRGEYGVVLEAEASRKLIERAVELAEYNLQ